MSETIHEYSNVITGIESQKDIIVLILTASRTDDNGNLVAITEAQKETAMQAGKSVLQCVGADVSANSTALLIPAVTLGENETLALNVSTVLTKTETESET